MPKLYQSLHENRDFLRLYRRGKSCAKPQLVVYAMKSRRGVCRVGITTSKKIGNAVERNRARRVIRAAYQSIAAENAVCGSWDFVFVARSKTTRLKSTKVESAMRDAFLQLGVMQ